jgi:hypothetical protein
MFRLVRFFSITSLVAFIIVTVVLVTVSRQAAIEDLTALGESKNVALTQSFANSLWPEFAPLAEAAPSLTTEELQAHPLQADLRQRVIAQMEGLTVAKVKVYDLQGITIFSTEEKQIGEDKSTNEGFLAAREGQVASELSHRDTFSAFEGTVSDRDLISSYIPVRPGGPDSEIVAVMEVYDDVTPLFHRIEERQRTQGWAGGDTGGSVRRAVLRGSSRREPNEATAAELAVSEARLSAVLNTVREDHHLTPAGAIMA